MATKWQVKEEEKKDYKTSIGRTDYNIPMIGYKSAIFILIAGITTVFAVPYLMQFIFKDHRLPTVLLSGLIMGFSVSFSQYYIDRKKQPDKKFYLLGGLLSLFMTGVFFFMYYAGILF